VTRILNNFCLLEKATRLRFYHSKEGRFPVLFVKFAGKRRGKFSEGEFVGGQICRREGNAVHCAAA